MPGRVFISSGQRPEEKQIVEQVASLLRTEFELDPYVAVLSQTFDDVMAVVTELRRADYFLFIDFKRPCLNAGDLPISLFTHQELAIARLLGFTTQAIFLKQQGTPLEGFLRYILGNAIEFCEPSEAPNLVRQLAKGRGWHKAFSRNLVAGSLIHNGPARYRDHTGPAFGQAPIHDIWHVEIRNSRDDVAASGVTCALAEIEEVGQPPMISFDRSPLKWAELAAYEITIMPGDFVNVDAFALQGQRPGILLHSLRDVRPRQAIIGRPGEWRLRYRVASANFPILEFGVHLDLVRESNDVFAVENARLEN